MKKIIALLADSDSDADAYLANQGKPTASIQSQSGRATPATTTNGANRSRSAGPAPVTSEGRVKASPAARKLAAERGVALAHVGIGSGPGGRILSTDLANMVPSLTTAASTAATGEIRRPLSKCGERSDSICNSRSRPCRIFTCGRRSTPTRCWRSTANRKRQRTARSTT